MTSRWAATIWYRHDSGPVDVGQVLRRLPVDWRLVKPPRTWPDYGLARVQWEGPWTALGVPHRVRYRHTHWVGARHRVPGDQQPIRWEPRP